MMPGAMLRTEDHRAIIAASETLTARESEVAVLVSSYYTVARELPSAGWLARRLSISRKNAREHVVALRRKNWFQKHLR